MSTLIEKLKAAKTAQTDRPQSQMLKSSDIDLRGTGLTKKLAAKAENAYLRETSKSIKSGDDDLISNAEANFRSGIEATLAEMKAANSKEVLQYDDSQLRAVAGIIHNRVSCLIGAAGTGKTTVTKKVVKELEKFVRVVHIKETVFVTCENAEGKKFRCLLQEAIRNNWKILDEKYKNNGEENLPGICFSAFTGRASQQIKRAIPEEWHRNISTIHSLLGYAPDFEEREYLDPLTGNMGWKNVRVFKPSFGEACKLPYTIYVLDEASMVPIPLFNELIAAMPQNARILLIGDIHQLPPPYGKGVLGYAMKKWPTFELTTIHRQAAGNAIISNAHNVLNGKMLQNAVNFHMIGNDARASKLAPTGQSELQMYFLGIIKKLSQTKLPSGEFCYNPLKDNVIVPSNKNLCGTIELNEKLVLMFNPEEKDEHGVIVNKRQKIHTGKGFAYFALRDKVMIKRNINQTEPPITNGMLGVIESINFNGKYDMKRSQIGDDDVLDLDEDAPIDLDLDNLNFALDGEKTEEKDDDGSDNQQQASHVMAIRFENGQTYECSTAGDYSSVVHGYATTCHKAQGGEYPNIIILCHSINSVQLTQEWLYTALTRARNNVFLVCNKRGLDQALARQTIKGKTLEEKIKSYTIELGIGDNENEFDTSKYPILWKPEVL